MHHYENELSQKTSRTLSKVDVLLPSATLSTKNDQGTIMLNSLYKTGILWMLAWCAIFTLYMAVIKTAGHDVNIVTMVFVRSLFGCLALLPFYSKQNIRTFKTRRHKIYLLRALCIVIAMICTYTACTHLPLSFATAINNTRPVMIAVLSIFILQDIINPKQWLAVLISYAGVWFLVSPELGGSYFGIGMALCGNLFAGIGFLLVKKLTDSDPPTIILLYSNALTLLFIGIITPFYWQMPSLEKFYLLLLMGTLGVAAQACYVQAIQKGRPALLDCFEHSRLLIAVPIGIIWFGEMLTSVIVIGSLCILMGNMYIARTATKR